MKNFNKLYFLVFFLLVLSSNSFGQTSLSEENKEDAYTKVLTQRADKIVKTLEISEEDKYKRVSNVITQQYRAINQHHEELKNKLKLSKEKFLGNFEKISEEATAIETDANHQLKKLHEVYIATLSQDLNAQQIEKVKDGMTYGVLPITYKAYQEMLPGLTDVQKTKILTLLTEAREHAMSAGSSDKKHGWFGKYKGKINNYLSAEGINMKEASKEWEEKIRMKNQNSK
jgi:hypothetical protein